MKRLLLISYYFPPSGGPGVQRALKFARYLPRFGWAPTVLTVRPEDAAYPDLDPALEQEVPAFLRVERTAAWDPYALYARMQGKAKHEAVGVGFLGEAEAGWKQRLGRWVRANLFLPDARVLWVPFAVRRGHALLKAEPFDAILSTSPPHSAHLAGWVLARRHHLPWVADFRDPWTGIDYYDLLPMTAPARRLDAWMEGVVLRDAAGVTVVTPSMERVLRRRVDRPYEVILNGFDPEDFTQAAAVEASCFELTHVGRINEARNPQALWRALQALEAPVRLPRLRVRLVGPVDPVVLQDARRHGVETIVETQPYVPHPEAVRQMQQSALLLLLINRVAGAEGIMTGKLYEYLASGRPVLGIGPVQGDAAAVLRAAGAGEMFDYDDAAALGRFVQAQYEAWAAGTPVAGAAPAAARAYSRVRQTEQLAALLDRLVTSG